ncbi:MAG: TIGR02300 family protein [Inquilinus sp.]|nr:TIGR02300 family protein [Inquilinus sp.]
MAKMEWGAKHICHSCGTRYYDMCRDPIVCPKCNTSYDPEAFLKSRRSRSAALEEIAQPARKKPAAKPEAAVVDEAEVEAEDELEVEEVVLDADDVGDDTASKKPAAASDDDVADTDDDDADADVLLEDASELGDDDIIQIDDKPEQD